MTTSTQPIYDDAQTTTNDLHARRSVDFFDVKAVVKQYAVAVHDVRRVLYELARSGRHDEHSIEERTRETGDELAVAAERVEHDVGKIAKDLADHAYDGRAERDDIEGDE